MNKSRIYETINGLQIEYAEPDPKLARFLAKVERAIEDQSVNYVQMLALAFSEENPLMQPSPLGGAMATKETVSHPVYRVLNDMLERKHLTARGADVSRLAAGYTLTVTQAAEKIGAHESTIRKAIREGRLACWVKNGQHYLHPKWLAQFQLATEKSRIMAEEPSRTRTAGNR